METKLVCERAVRREHTGRNPIALLCEAMGRDAEEMRLAAARLVLGVIK